MPYNERVHISNNVEETVAIQSLLFFCVLGRRNNTAYNEKKT